MRTKETMKVETKERGGVVMNDHLYKLNQWTNDMVLKNFTNEQSLKERNSAAAGLSPRPTPKDPVREALHTRQKQLHTLGDSDALIRQARENLMKEARAEFAAVMQQLNVLQEEPKKQTAVLAETTEDRIEQAAMADQPEQKFECPSDIYQQKLYQNDAATIIAGEPH
jgi:hypothetical protein